MNQKQKSALTKIFSIAGTILLLAPIAFMLLTAVVGSIMNGRLLCDYLMLAELFPIVAFGFILLILASLLSRTFARWFGWGTVAALVALGGGQLIASLSGLAHGTTSTDSIAFVIVIATIILYNLIVIALAILGIVLNKRLFQKQKQESDSVN